MGRRKQKSSKPAPVENDSARVTWPPALKSHRRKDMSASSSKHRVPWVQLPEGPLIRIFELLQFEGTPEARTAVGGVTCPTCRALASPVTLTLLLTVYVQLRYAGAACRTWRSACLEALLEDTAASRPRR